MSPSASWIRCVASLPSRSTSSCRSRSRLRSRSATSCSARAPFGGVLLELRVACCVDLLRGAASSSARRRAISCALLLDLALQPLGVLADARLDLRHQLPLPRLDALQLVGEAPLQLLDVGAPVGHALLDGALHLAELRRRASRSRRAPARRRRAVVPRRSAAPRRRAAESASARAAGRASRSSSSLRCSSLVRDDRVELALAALDLALERALLARARGAASTTQRAERGDGDERGDDRDDGGGGHAVHR